MPVQPKLIPQYPELVKSIGAFAPSAFTLRQLVDMADGRIVQQWNHTSALMALIANAHRDPKKTRPFKPQDFHPLQRKAEGVISHVDVSILKNVFIEPLGGK